MPPAAVFLFFARFATAFTVAFTMEFFRFFPATVFLDFFVLLFFFLGAFDFFFRFLPAFFDRFFPFAAFEIPLLEPVFFARRGIDSSTADRPPPPLPPANVGAGG